MRVRALAPLLFLSGAAALVLEVCWFRRMAQVAGGTALAMGAVLAAVIGGMAVGSFLIGKRADRVASPLKLYGLLELGVAVFALLTPTLIDATSGLFANQSVALKFICAVVLLAPPAILMGGTLPAAAAALKKPDGRSIGWLYATNTIGAVGGTVVAGFFLIPAFGLAASMRWAALLSGGAGAAAVALGLMGWGARGEAPVARSGSNPRRAITLYAVSGFMGLAAEVAFTRQLVLVFGSSTYAFSTVLAVFLLGIGVGGAIGTRFRTNRLRKLEWTVAITAALFSLGALAVYFLPRLYIQGYVSLGSGFGAGLFLRFLLAAAVLLPGCIGLGIAFPLAAHEAGATGGSTGRLYAANTLASVAGSTLAVFLFVPLLGPRLTVVAIAVVAGLACGKRRLPVLLITLCGFIPPNAVAREHLLAGVFFSPSAFLRNGEIDEDIWDEGVDIPFAAHGRDATVSIWRWYGLSSLLVNGKAVASNQILADAHHLALLGHLPMAVHRGPKRVLVVGLGMGTTYNAVLKHRPQVLRVVEIEEAVVKAAARLGVKPNDVIVADARSYLKATDELFDVITSDPIHPWVRGGGDLYTVEYFRSVRDRLAPGGVACQWLPVYQMGLGDVRDVVRTFREVFAAHAYYGGGDLVLVGKAKGEVPLPRPLPVDWMGTRDLTPLLVSQDLTQVAGTILTDDSLRLEFSTPRHVESPEMAQCLAWIAGLWDTPPAPYKAVLHAQIAWARGDGALMDEMLAEARKQAPGHGFVERFTGEVWLLRAGDYTRNGAYKNAGTAIAWAKRYLRKDPRVKGARAELLDAQGDREGAKKLYRELIKQSPDSDFLKRKLE